MNIPCRQIRATYNENLIRVYQAFSDEIANTALEHGTFINPPFKMDRMTWIKPSFLWTMYRSGWGEKDPNQKRILAIDITREGFEWALRNSSLSHYESNFYSSEEKWLEAKHMFPVRIQWDPERNLLLEPQEYRTIQIGLSKQAVQLYIHDWINKITDVTDLVHKIHKLTISNKIEEASVLLPVEREYITTNDIKNQIGVTL